MTTADLILYNYYKFYSKDGIHREATNSMRGGRRAPEDMAYGLFCVCFMCWLGLFSLLINLVAYHKIRTPYGFALCLLFIPFYMMFSKKYSADFEIVGIYERVKAGGKNRGAFITTVYSSSFVLVIAALFIVVIFNIQ